MKKIVVILSGCGFQDGVEITEAVSTLVCLSELGADYRVFAPNRDFQAKNHLSGENQEMRNVLSESARIARGSLSDLSSLKIDEFDGVVFPGGYGAGLHFSDWALKGSACSVNAEIEAVINGFYDAGKPMAAICIAPALVAKVLGKKGVTVTIGDDVETAAEIEKTGSIHKKCAVDSYVHDRENKIITTPAYMYGEALPHQVFYGIRTTLSEFIKIA